MAEVKEFQLKWFKFQSFAKVGHHIQYTVKARARTKYLRVLSEDACGEFELKTRYSELLALRHALQKELKKSGDKEFPRFPGKRLNPDHAFLQNRMLSLELYFEELFLLKPEITLSPILQQFCKPIHMDFALLGGNQALRSSFLAHLFTDLRKQDTDQQCHSEPAAPRPPSVASLQTSQSDPVESLAIEEEKQDSHFLFPMDIVIGSSRLLRLDFRQFEQDGRGSTYCAQMGQNVIILVAEGNSLEAEKYLSQWEKAGKRAEKPICAVVAVDMSSLLLREWLQSAEGIRSFYSEISLKKSGGGGAAGAVVRSILVSAAKE